MLRRSFMLILGSAVASGFQRKPKPSADSVRRADIYAIYSRLMTDPKTSHGPDNNEIYLIRGMTVPGVPAEPCVRVPLEYERSLAEILTDYDRRKGTAVILERALQIPKPYRLLKGDEVTAFIQSQVGSGGAGKAADLFGLTDVYFNRSRTLALTGISTYCGMLCGLDLWKMFEKTDSGRWEERLWVTCTTES